MVNDIRPEAAALLKQIAGIPQRKSGSITTTNNKVNTPIMRRESRVGSGAPELKTRDIEPKSRNTIGHTQASHLTNPKTSPADGGLSVVDKVFNQLYSSSGFLDEEEAVPERWEQLGTRLDVYA